MIRVDDLTKYFGDVHAVDGLTFEMFEGEILGFLGPNGAGKTTTMRILTCFFPPTSGKANVAGFDVMTEPDEVRRIIGYMPEGVPLYKEMPVTDFLDFIAHSKGYRRAARRKYVDMAIEETNLANVRNRLVGQLSKGYRQRVGLAQAILGEPKVLILDEPTSGLDPRQIADMRALIKRMAGKRTVILSTHILPEVQMTCSRVIIINKGKIAASGTPEKLTTRMQNKLRYDARIIGPQAEVAAALESVAGVVEVTRREPRDADEGLVRGVPGMSYEYNIVSRIDAADARPSISRMVAEKAWSLVELKQIGLSLEDIFLRIVAGEQIDAPEGATPAEGIPSVVDNDGTEAKPAEAVLAEGDKSK